MYMCSYTHMSLLSVWEGDVNFPTMWFNFLSIDSELFIVSKRCRKSIKTRKEKKMLFLKLKFRFLTDS